MTQRIYCSYADPKQLEKYPPDWEETEVEVVPYDTTVGIGPDKINHLHPYWSDYVCMYDVWKNNLKTDFVGFEQYSRRLDYKMLVTDANACNVFHKVTFRGTVADMYAFFHDQRDMLEIAEIIINQSGSDPLNPTSNPYVKYLFTEHLFYSESVFFMSWENFTKMMGFVFSILSEYDMKYNLNLEPEKYCEWTKKRAETAQYNLRGTNTWEYQRRVFGYLAERLVSAYIYVNFDRDKIVESCSNHEDYETFIRQKIMNGDYDYMFRRR